MEAKDSSSGVESDGLEILCHKSQSPRTVG